MVTTIARYGTWRSPITAELVTAAQVGLGQPALDRGLVYWLEGRPQEGGRMALVRYGRGGPRGRDAARASTSAPACTNMAAAPGWFATA